MRSKETLTSRFSSRMGLGLRVSGLSLCLFVLVCFLLLFFSSFRQFSIAVPVPLRRGRRELLKSPSLPNSYTRPFHQEMTCEVLSSPCASGVTVERIQTDPEGPSPLTVVSLNPS